MRLSMCLTASVSALSTQLLSLLSASWPCAPHPPPPSLHARSWLVATLRLVCEWRIPRTSATSQQCSSGRRSGCPPPPPPPLDPVQFPPPPVPAGLSSDVLCLHVQARVRAELIEIGASDDDEVRLRHCGIDGRLWGIKLDLRMS